MAGRVGGTEQPDWDSAMQLFPMGCSPVCTLLLPAAPTVLTAPVRLVGSPCDLPVSAPKHVAECRPTVSASIGCCSSALRLLLLLVPAPLVAPPPCHVCVMLQGCIPSASCSSEVWHSLCWCSWQGQQHAFRSAAAAAWLAQAQLVWACPSWLGTAGSGSPLTGLCSSLARVHCCEGRRRARDVEREAYGVGWAGNV